MNNEFGGALLLLCYEAGPRGYGLNRQLIEAGHECQVFAPSLIPKKPGERIKTDRRDALKLAQLLRAGDLTAVWVSDTQQEAMRGIDKLAATVLLAELVDISCFESPKQLMAYLGLVPSGHSSGSRLRAADCKAHKLN